MPTAWWAGPGVALPAIVVQADIMSFDMGPAKRAIESYFESTELPNDARIDIENGFHIWRGRFRQTVWYDDPFEDEDGTLLWRLHARIDVFKGFLGTPEQSEIVESMMLTSVLSGPIRNPQDSSRIQLASSIYVTEENEANLSNFFSIAALAQIADAFWITDLLAGDVLEVDHSTHPSGSTFGEDPDEMRGLVDYISNPGQSRSRFIGEEMRTALAECTTPPTVLVTGDDTLITAEYPYMGQTSIAKISANFPHPIYGSSMAATLTADMGTDQNVVSALEMNERELRENTLVNFIGSWKPGDGSLLSHMICIPNAFFKVGLVPYLILPNLVFRAHWLACKVGSDEWANGGFQLAYSNKMEFLSSLLPPKKPSIFKRIFGR